MFTGPSIWSYLLQINTILQRNLHPCEEINGDVFWTRSLDLTGDGILVYQRYIYSLKRFETINRGVESRLSIRDFSRLSSSENLVVLHGREDAETVQNITFRAGEYAENTIDDDWGMDEGESVAMTMLFISQADHVEMLELLNGLIAEMDNAILFSDQPPSQWLADVEVSRRLGVWEAYQRQNEMP